MTLTTLQGNWKLCAHLHFFDAIIGNHIRTWPISWNNNLYLAE